MTGRKIYIVHPSKTEINFKIIKSKYKQISNNKLGYHHWNYHWNHYWNHHWDHHWKYYDYYDDDYYLYMKNNKKSESKSIIKKFKLGKEKKGYINGWKNIELKKLPLSYLNIKKVDLRNNCPEIYDQGELDSCTSNSVAFAFRYCNLIKNNDSTFNPSRLFIYYNEKQKENTNDSISTMIFNTLFSLIDIGVCDEIEWPYDITKSSEPPSDMCYESAKNHKIIKCKTVPQKLEYIKAMLIIGYPVIFGFKIYPGFESELTSSTGVLSMPEQDDPILGYHSGVIVGFNNNKGQFIVANSFGKEFGDNGYLYIPYQYILNPLLSSGFWCIQDVTI